jgi:purine-binding chemotaxis protein CheW
MEQQPALKRMEQRKMAETRLAETQQSEALAALAGKYLTFKVANEEYGLEIMKVAEIIGMMPVTRVPRVPEYVRGVINLRGRIVPCVELRSKFGLEPTPDTDKTCIIVVEAESANGRINMGIIVDEVAEVLDVQAQDIDEAPEFGANVHTDFILGVGIVKSSVKILLDIDRVLSASEMRAVQAAAGGSTN